jgi:hypothetical protein
LVKPLESISENPTAYSFAARLMRRRYDHIDLRVRSLAEARPFYETLLPALGFTRDVRIEHWLQLEAAGAGSATEFFGATESSRHVANECRIAFWADSPSEVDRHWRYFVPTPILIGLVRTAGPSP